MTISDPFDHPIYDVIIVGAGISGLSARRSLQEGGKTVLTLEKSRGLSGRASTRRREGVVADMGAQFVTAKAEPWQSLLSRGADDGVRAIRLPDAPQFARYVHSAGMSRLGRLLTEEPERPESPILRTVKAIRLDVVEGGQLWEVLTEPARRFRSRALILTAPLPQSLDLLGDRCAGAQLEDLRGVIYSPCLAGAFVLDQPTPLVAPGILRAPSPKLAGIYDQSKKGVETSSPVVVVHGAPELSRELWGASEASVLSALWREARLAAPGALPETYAQSWLQKWRYCEPLRILDRLYEKIDPPLGSPPVLLAGDAFGGSRVEGAFESGRAAGRALLPLRAPTS
jgi:predicted NAD/FAD-dependent oxidoreductase